MTSTTFKTQISRLQMLWENQRNSVKFHKCQNKICDMEIWDVIKVSSSTRKYWQSSLTFSPKLIPNIYPPMSIHERMFSEKKRFVKHAPKDHRQTTGNDGFNVCNKNHVYDSRSILDLGQHFSRVSTFKALHLIDFYDVRNFCVLRVCCLAWMR